MATEPLGTQQALARVSALNGVRVVELAESVAGEYCGKLLADFGADVIKVERPGCGSPTRAMAPLVGETGGCERSGLFAYLNTNKRSVILDVAREQEVLNDLVASSHAVIDDNTSQPQIAGRHPDVVFCSITPYGQGAPAEMQNAKSLNVFHCSGWGYHTPSNADPALPPLKGPGRFLADYEAGLDAALCIASSLFAQLHTGDGEFIDVSAQAALVSRADCILGRFITGEITPEDTRADYDQQGPASIFACRDGHVYLYMTNSAHWVGLKELMGRPSWLDDFDDDWLEFSVTPREGRGVSQRLRLVDPRRGQAAGHGEGAAAGSAPGTRLRHPRACSVTAVPPPRLLRRRHTSGSRHGALSHGPIQAERIPGQDHHSGTVPRPAHRAKRWAPRKPESD